MDRYRKVIIILVVVLLVAVVAIVGYSLWFTYSVGKLSINMLNTGISYQVDGKGITYSDSRTINGISVGKHSIQAFGTVKDYYVPKTFSVDVKANQTATLSINLFYTPKNPDYSGVELGPNDSIPTQ